MVTLGAAIGGAAVLGLEAATRAVERIVLPVREYLAAVLQSPLLT